MIGVPFTRLEIQPQLRLLTHVASPLLSAPIPTTHILSVHPLLDKLLLVRFNLCPRFTGLAGATVVGVTVRLTLISPKFDDRLLLFTLSTLLRQQFIHEIRAGVLHG
jgi:hypothetical protein